MNIQERLVEYFGFTPELHDTVDSLGMDSLEQVRFIMSMEEMFAIEISDEEVDSLYNVQDVVNLVERKINKMQIKIVKATENAYWYSNRIGEVYSVVGESEEDYCVSVEDTNVHHRMVQKEDAEIVNPLPNGIDKLDYLHCLIAASRGDVYMYWDVKESKIKYQLLLLEDDQIETDSFEDVEGVLEALSLIRVISNKNKA